MLTGRKSGLFLTLSTIPLIMLALYSTGCTGTDNSNNSETGSEITENKMPGGDPAGMPGRGNRTMAGMQNLDEVAAILGIETEALEDAINQAMSELFEEGQVPSGEDLPEGTPPEGQLPEGEPPEGEFPEGMPPAGQPFEGTPPEGQPGMMPEELLSRVAEILDIDLETLKDAFTRVQDSTT